jgi:hypothetical protein
MIVLIDWLIDWTSFNPFLSSPLGIFKFPNLKKYNKASRYKKNLSKGLTSYYYKVQKLFGLFSFMSWHEKTNKRKNFRRETWASCRLLHGGGQRRPIIHAKAKGVLSTQLLTPLLQSVPALSLSPQLILQADLVLGLFFYYLWPPSKVGWCACKNK